MIMIRQPRNISIITVWTHAGTVRYCYTITTHYICYIINILSLYIFPGHELDIE